MKLYLLTAALCCFALSCHGNPVLLDNNVDDQIVVNKPTETELKGEVQEATQGVFKKQPEVSAQTEKSKAETPKATEGAPKKEETTEKAAVEITTLQPEIAAGVKETNSGI